MIIGYLNFDLRALANMDTPTINIEDMNGFYAKAGRVEAFNFYTELARADNDMVWASNLPVADLKRLSSTHGTVTWEEGILTFDDLYGEDVTRPTQLLHRNVLYQHKEVTRLLPRDITTEEQAILMFRINENLEMALNHFFETSLEYGEEVRDEVLNPEFQTHINQDPMASELKAIFTNEQFQPSAEIKSLALPMGMANQNADIAFVRFNPVSHLKTILQANIPPNISPQAGKALYLESVPEGANIFMVQIRGAMADGSMDFWLGYKKWLLCKDEVNARAFLYYQNTGESAKVTISKNLFLPFIEFSLSFGLVAKQITKNITQCTVQTISRSQGSVESAEEALKAEKGIVGGISYQNWLYKFEQEALLIEAGRAFSSEFDVFLAKEHEWDGFFIRGVSQLSEEQRHRCDILCEQYDLISPFGQHQNTQPNSRTEELRLITRRVGQTSIAYQLELDKFILKTLKEGEKNGKEKAMISILRHMNETMPTQFESKTQEAPLDDIPFFDGEDDHNNGSAVLGMVTN